MAPSTATWPAAVSERSATLVHGAPRRATVLAAFPTALYLQVGGHADVLPVVARHALRLPTALAVATSLPTVGWGAQPGDEVVVGEGEVRLAGVTLRAVRTWRPHPTPRATTHPAVGAFATLALPWRSPARALTALLLGRDRAAHTLGERVGALVGAGPGLTPSGDDVLCGVLLGLRLHPRGAASLVDELWHAVAPRLTATTSLSASLLREAADGYAVEPVTRLLHRLASPGSAASSAAASSREGAAVTQAVQDVLAIGHTSGADLLGGLAGCLDALNPAPATAPPPLTAPPALTAPSATATASASSLSAIPQSTTPLSATPRSLP